MNDSMTAPIAFASQAEKTIAEKEDAVPLTRKGRPMP
jgi:hypothetical protein